MANCVLGLLPCRWVGVTHFARKRRAILPRLRASLACAYRSIALRLTRLHPGQTDVPGVGLAKTGAPVSVAN